MLKLVCLGVCAAAITCFQLAETANAAIFNATSDADSYVRLGQPAMNFGGSPVVVKDSGTGSTTRKGYVRFDVSSANGVFTDATLSLETSINNNGGGGTIPQSFTVNVFGLKDGNSGENWGEGSINWNNAPANNTANNSITNGASFLGQLEIPATAAPDTVTFTSGALKSFLNTDTDGNATIILTREGGNGSHNLGFSSKEGPSAPSLSGDVVAGDVTKITTGDGQGADSYVRLGEPDTNFGGANNLLAKNSGNNSTTRKSYLRFDLSTLSPTDLLDAALMLDVDPNNAGGGSSSPVEHVVSVYGLKDGDAGESWDESSITWNNAPANGGSNSILGNADLLGEFTVIADNAPTSVLFTSQDFLDFIAADTNQLATIILTHQTASGSSNLGFASKENSTLLAPTLVLSTAAVIPEPSTYLVFGGLAVCFGVAGWWRKRRKAA